MSRGRDLGLFREVTTRNGSGGSGGELTMASRAGEEVFVQNLTKLLRNYGDSVLSGTSTLSLLTTGLQKLHQLFEQHLLARKYQHGFVALPSHPSDTASVLEVQFLFDVFQKTMSLKLVHPPGPKLQTPVRIFAFKSLRFLELKRVPPHCLEGLRGVYARLEILVCSFCINTVEEIISICGGDLSSALPWPDLHTLNFSNNFITSLDNSLGLLNVLQTLDLSHNRIRDCAENLQLLSELEYVNLSYNLLEKVPIFNSCSRVQLVTLVLRNNELDNITGLELLSHLKCLDLAYNMICEHTKLAPLSHLHRLKELFLEGNPVYYLRNHRACTIYHLSPKAAFMRLALDGEPVTMAELIYLPRTGRLISHTGRHSPRGSVLKNVLESSTPSEYNDCQPLTDGVPAPIIRKKSKVKVRAASISEPSDSDPEVRENVAPSHMVLQHQEDIKRMDELRGQIGDDWLRYQHYLNSPSEETSSRPTDSSTTKDEADASIGDLLGSASQGDICEDSADLGMEQKEEEEATLTAALPVGQGDCTSSSYLTPEDGVCVDESMTIVEKREEEPVRDVCQPFIVGRVVTGEPNLDNSWIFLRVTEEALLEVDLMNADILERLELSTLTAIRTDEEFWPSRGRLLPSVECCFSYIRKDKRKRKYVIMDTNPQEASQILIKILTEALEARQQQSDPEAFSRLQCLKCRHEFEELQKTRGLSESPSLRQEDEQDHPETEASSPALPACPKCASDHVVILPSKTEIRTSTPVLPEEGELSQDFRKILSTDNDPTGSLKNVESLSGAGAPGDESLAASSAEPESSAFTGGKTASFYLDCEQTCSSGSTRDGSRLSDSSGGEEQVPATSDPSVLRATRVTSSPGLFSSQLSQRGSSGSLCGSLTWTFRYSMPVGSTLTRHSPYSDSGDDAPEPCKGADFNLSVEDFQTIDHRLKLFLDVEIFTEDKEEYQCFVKASTVKFGSPEEYASLLIMSNLNVYILEITGLPSGQPSNWLRKREVHPIQDLLYLQVGLRTQSIGMEFDSAGSSYTLLIRNPSKCKNFIQFFTDMVRELTPVSKLQSISFTRMDPQHKLWPLIQEHPEVPSSDGKRPNYLYVLVFLIQDDVLSPVTMLATSSTLHLLTEDHQWKKVTSEAASPPPSEILIKESQPISNISSISLYKSAPHDVRLNIYHEVSRTESAWHLRAECTELLSSLVTWIREYWEEMFGVALKITAHQVPE